MAVLLTRDDIIGGLSALVVELHASRETAGIRLVGGAGLALRHFDRGTTQDLDALHIESGSAEVVAEAAAAVARAPGWSPDRLNFAARSLIEPSPR